METKHKREDTTTEKLKENEEKRSELGDRCVIKKKKQKKKKNKKKNTKVTNEKTKRDKNETRINRTKDYKEERSIKTKTKKQRKTK